MAPERSTGAPATGEFTWDRSGKLVLDNLYFATKGAIPPVWLSIRLLTCEI